MRMFVSLGFTWESVISGNPEDCHLFAVVTCFRVLDP